MPHTEQMFREIIGWLILAAGAVGSIVGLELRATKLKAQATEQAQCEPAQVKEPLRASLLFVGDWMQHTPQLVAAHRGEGFDYSSSIEFVAPIMRKADLTVVNLETTLHRRPPYMGYPLFRSPAALADALRQCGVDVALLANNHCCDGGSEGISTTIVELSKRGISHTGVFSDSLDHKRNRILYLSRKGIRFALLNYTYGTNGLPTPRGRIVHRIDTLEMARDLSMIDRRRCDCIIATLHWGNEYEHTPNSEQRSIAAFLRRQGVALIIGSHPHVIQPIEADSSHLTAWSLGNFVSNQRQRYTDGGLMLEIEVEKRDTLPCTFSYKVTPLWVDQRGYRILPREVADTLPLSPVARQRYLQFQKDCHLLLADSLYK